MLSEDGDALLELLAGAALGFCLSQNWSRTRRGQHRRLQRCLFGARFALSLEHLPLLPSRTESRPQFGQQFEARSRSQARPPSRLGRQKEPRRGSTHGTEGGGASRRSNLRRSRPCPSQAGDLDLYLALPNASPKNNRGGTCLHRRVSLKPRVQVELTLLGARAACRCVGEESSSAAKATQAHGTHGAVRGHEGRAN